MQEWVEKGLNGGYQAKMGHLSMRGNPKWNYVFAGANRAPNGMGKCLQGQRGLLDIQGMHWA